MVDAGDSLISADAKRRGSVNAQNVKKSELMADFLKITKPDAIALGDVDMIAGPAAADTLLTSRGFTPIATNARFDNPEIKTVPYVAWESAGYRFVIVNLFAQKSLAGVEGVTVSEPLAALDALVASAGKVDVLVVCCHRFEDPLIRRLAEKEGPLRIIIDAEGATRVRGISATTRTILAKPPGRGTELLRADLYMKRGAPSWYQMDRYADAVRTGKPLEAEAAAAAECSLVDFDAKKLSGTIKGDPAVLKRIDEYKAWSRQAMMADVPEVAGAPKYTGAEACGACHKEQLANWKATVHAEAWESLEKDPDGGAQDPECVSCHVSGFLQPGGVRKIEDTGPFRGVQCESCHAPVATHPGGAKHGKIGEALCKNCHSETRDPDFVYATYLKFATCTKPHDPATNRVPR
ncbi:MAG: hypothetical protein K8T20_01165 [Planctomycetes bacterium]|nr:hypothetical protein [Planctomycetota bacterium]